MTHVRRGRVARQARQRDAQARLEASQPSPPPRGGS